MYYELEECIVVSSGQNFIRGIPYVLGVPTVGALYVATNDACRMEGYALGSIPTPALQSFNSVLPSRPNFIFEISLHSTNMTGMRSASQNPPDECIFRISCGRRHNLDLCPSNSLGSSFCKCQRTEDKSFSTAHLLYERGYPRTAIYMSQSHPNPDLATDLVLLH